jgi:precorrin-4 methylase
MRIKLLIAVGICGLYLGAVSAIAGDQVNKASGKFYIVGMGTAPDLMTLRAQKVINGADILLAEEGSFDGDWSRFTQGKEVWQWPHNLRRYYGVDPKTLQDPAQRSQAETLAKSRRDLAEKIRSAVQQGKVVACLEGGDPMMYGMTLFLELLPPDLLSEIVPGVGAFQAASAAVKMSPPYGYDTSAVILTMGDWPGRSDTNEKLMAMGSTMVFYTMGLDYPKVFAQLKRFYPPSTPVAVVCNAGDRDAQKVIRSTVGRFLEEVDFRSFPRGKDLLLVGKFLQVGQARKDFLVPRTLPPGGHNEQLGFNMTSPPAGSP